MAYRGRLPSRQLNSRRAENSLRAYLLPMVSTVFRRISCSNSLKKSFNVFKYNLPFVRQLQRDGKRFVSCRAIWKTTDDDIKLAKQLICNKRRQLDRILFDTGMIQVLVSAIGGVTVNPKSRKAANNTDGGDGDSDETSEVESRIYPSVSFFIASENDNLEREKEEFFRCLHEAETDVEIKEINCRKGEAMTLKELGQVVKDFNNSWTKDLVEESNRFCYKQLLEEELGEGVSYSTVHVPIASREKIVKIYISKSNPYQEQYKDIVTKLEKDGIEATLMIEDQEVVTSINPNKAPRSWAIGQTIDRINNAMQAMNHRLYRGDVYIKHESSLHTYVRFAHVDSYLNKLTANASLREEILSNMASFSKILKHQDCQVIKQIVFDFDLIEVSKPEGKCFSISRRAFIDYPSETYGAHPRSPRAFLPFDSDATEIDAGYFQEGIENSFPDQNTRIQFLNKFYQCLCVGQMPQKCRKLVVEGPRDSGKTTWANVFLAIIPLRFVASITREKQFSASMLNDDTQIVLLDEWAEDTLQSDMAKVVLQGGFMVSAVKHADPKIIMNSCPFYITTNHVPYFGENEDENVKRRLKIFETRALEKTTPNVDVWIREHAMDCVAWMAKEINENTEMLEEDERWYEANYEGIQTQSSHKEEMATVDLNVMQNITSLGEATVSGAVWRMAEVENYDPQQFWDDNQKENAKLEAEMRQEDEDERRDLGIKVRSVRESDGENDDDLLDFTSPSYKRAVLVMLIQPTHVLSLRPYDNKRYEVRRQDNFAQADPAYDAWLLRNGHERRQFPIKEFLETYPRARCLVEDGEDEEPYLPAEEDNPYLLSQRYRQPIESNENNESTSQDLQSSTPHSESESEACEENVESGHKRSYSMFSTFKSFLSGSQKKVKK